MTHVQRVEHDKHFISKLKSLEDSSKVLNGSSCFTLRNFEAEIDMGASTFHITDLNESMNVLMAHYGAEHLQEDPGLFVEMHDDEIRNLWVVSRPPLVSDDDSFASGIRSKDFLRFAGSTHDSVLSSAGDIIESDSDEDNCFGGTNRNSYNLSTCGHIVESNPGPSFCCYAENDNDSNYPSVHDYYVDRSIASREQKDLTISDFCCGECGQDSPRSNNLAYSSIVSPGPSPHGKVKKNVFVKDMIA